VNVTEDFTRRSRDQFLMADYGCELELNEQKRRYVLKSLLRNDGLEFEDYAAFFRSEVLNDLPQLAALEDEGLAVSEGGRMKLTAEGLELSDVIGPWLWSEAVRDKMNHFVLR
jgi:oxygen-independent coproporphyrinogen-3 oxidase